MNAHLHRDTVRQLAEDLSWLEAHCRRQSELSVHAAHLRLGAALARNVIGPTIEAQPAKPLFLAVVGGAGAGKSTVVNFLAGSVVAEANPQAGYTRHPTAFLPASLGTAWPSSLGFLGPLQRLSGEQPANLDEDVYQVKRIPAGRESDPLADTVIWDCPDMTTWASMNYVSRLMEVVALADVVVYVASDERYNDAVPTQFLHLVIQAGKAVVVCLTKMNESDAPALTEHFRREVLGRVPTSAGEIPPIPIVTIPQLPPQVRRDPAGAGAKYRAQLLNQILVLCPTPETTRTRTIQNAVHYLETASVGLLDVARRDLAELELWRSLVASGRHEFEQRYRQEFLAGESFRRFDRTRDQVMEMLELPGAGRLLSVTLSLLRTPYRFVRDFATKVLVRPEVMNIPEQTVCSSALAAWMDQLQAESLRRADSHAIWKQITHAFDAGLKSQAQDRFLQTFRSFELKETTELDQAARSVPEKLIQHPMMLNLFRLGILTLDLVVIGVVIWATWPPQWWLLLVIPLAVSLTRQAVELIVRQAVELGRTRVRNKRENLLREHMSGPLEHWLAEWPGSGGTALEKLQQVLHRVPQAIRDLAAILRPVPDDESDGESPGETASP